jgi:hypothetical protein
MNMDELEKILAPILCECKKDCGEFPCKTIAKEVAKNPWKYIRR